MTGGRRLGRAPAGAAPESPGGPFSAAPAPRSDGPLGATVIPGGGVRFRVWAPRVRRMDVRIVAPFERTISMRRVEGDVFEATVEEAAAGAAYVYVIDGAAARPDPRSRRQARGVHGPSTVVDPAAFPWTDVAWRGLDLAACVFYECHVGSFTPEGTFDAAVERLSHLRDLGVTVLELMPVGAFPGTRGWGYDGVHPFAPQESYGGPDGLRRLVDAAHRAGLGVALDVVYNHLGPEGNYLREFGPYFTSRYLVPWGEAVNFDGADALEVRRWAAENAAAWVREYRVDALRLDAVHAIFDSSPRHVLTDVAEAARAEAARRGVPVHVVAESALNDQAISLPAAAGGLGLDSQWNDEVHHALRTAITREAPGYLAPYGRMADLARALTHGFVGPGTDVRTRASISGDATALGGHGLVAFLQNHDQVANASGGLRFAALAGVEAAKAAAAVVLCAPHLPMLFMGEEWAEAAPFLFFADFGDEALRAAVRAGRVREMRELGFDAAAGDPFAPETLARSRLDWSAPAREPHAAVLRLYRDLLALRRSTPALRNGRKDLTRRRFDEEARTILLERRDPAAPPALLVANLGADPATLRVEASAPLALALWTAAALYAGPGAPPPPARIAGADSVALAPRSAAIFTGE